MESDVKLRQDTDKETADKLKEFIVKLTALKNLELGKFDLVRIKNLNKCDLDKLIYYIINFGCQTKFGLK